MARLAFAASLPLLAADKEVLIVTGTYDPIPLEESERAVRVLPARQLSLLTDTFADLIHLDPSLDLRQRASGVVQSGLSIRGSSFGQTLVLLNGLRLNDVQTANHNMDIPVPFDSVAQVEVLRGSGSTLYGSDAVGGAINFITSAPEASEIRLRAGVGNFGVNQERTSFAYVNRGFAEQLTLSRDFSSGFAPDRDFRNLSLASTTAFRRTSVILAYNDRPFGADQFYGNYNSWERTKTWFTSLTQGFGTKTTAAFAYRRHSDLFVLYRDRPQVFTNRHIDESYQGSLRRREDLGTNVHLNYGVEGYRDSVDSNNLGSHHRARGSGYAALDVRALRRFSFTIGGREEVHGHKQQQFSPSIGAGYWLSPQWKLRASASRAFRLPSYTDLYYHDPANLGSPDLRPEHAASYEGGVDWRGGRGLRAEATVFSRRERDGIDYVRNSPADIWRATNFQSLNFTGIETSFGWEAGRGSVIDFRYTGLRGARAVLASRQSKYSFNYPTHSGVIAWQARLPRESGVRTLVGVLQRLGRDPYAVWDVNVAWSKYRVRPYAQLTNITDTVHEEIFGVRTPGRAAVVGFEWMLYRGRK